MKKTIVAIATVMFASLSQASISARSGSNDLMVIASPNATVQAYNQSDKLIAETETETETETNQYGRAKLKVTNSQLLSLVSEDQTVAFRHITRTDKAR